MIEGFAFASGATLGVIVACVAVALVVSGIILVLDR